MNYKKAFKGYLQNLYSRKQTAKSYFDEFELNSNKSIPIEKIMERCELKKHPYDMMPREFIAVHHKIDKAYKDICTEKGEAKGHTNFTTTNNRYKELMQEVIDAEQLSTFEDWLAEQTDFSTDEKNAARAKKQGFETYMKKKADEKNEKNEKGAKETTRQQYIVDFERIMNLYLRGGFDTYTYEYRNTPVIYKHPYFMTPHEFLDAYPKIKKEVDSDGDKMQARGRVKGHQNCRTTTRSYRRFMEQEQQREKAKHPQRLAFERWLKNECRKEDGSPLKMDPDGSHAYARSIEVKLSKVARKHHWIADSKSLFDVTEPERMEQIAEQFFASPHVDDNDKQEYKSTLNRYIEFLRWEAKKERQAEDAKLIKKAREVSVKSRANTGELRNYVLDEWHHQCSVGDKDGNSLCTNDNFLEACHIKPYSDLEDGEEESRYNGLMLTPNLHKAFDKGIITFAPDDGTIKIKEGHKELAKQLGIDETMRLCQPKNGTLHEETKKHLKYHHDKIFKKN